MNPRLLCFLWILLPEVAAEYNATLIKNITAILDTILDNYDKKLRPAHGKNVLQVRVDISVRSMGPISERDMEFSLDCYFRQIWVDERLKFKGPFKGKSLALAHKFLQEIWKPDTYIKNGRNSFLHTLTSPNILLRIREDGGVYISQRLTIRARCPMYLRKFPMDMQLCPLTVGSLGYSKHDIVYHWSDVRMEGEFEMELAQYKMLGVTKDEQNISDIRGCHFEELSVLNAYFKLERQQGYYILQIYTPCTLVVVMSWVSFWINKEASPARVMVGIMTVLNMSTIGLGHRGDLPKVSYSTALDIYIVVCFGFVFAALVEYAVINFADIVYLKRKVQQMSMLANALMGQRQNSSNSDAHSTASMNLEVCVEPKPRRSIVDRLLRRQSKNKNRRSSSFLIQLANKAAVAKRKLTVEDASSMVVERIDDVSKVMFPTLYFSFFLIYWISYLYLIPDELPAKSRQVCT